MMNKNILKIRKKLDLLDNALLNIIKKRTNLVNQILANKKFKKDIIDRKRINKIINLIRKKSRKKNIDPKITVKIWTAMIQAFIAYEYRNFKKK